jgi:predicted RNA-binding Zn ribbon-like protein
VRSLAETGLVVLDLVNTLDPTLADPERLPCTRVLARFLHEHGIAAAPSARDLAEVRALRAELRELVGLERAGALERSAALLAAIAPRATLVERDGRWAVVPRAAADASVRDRLALRAVAELADLSAAPGLERLRRCAADPCTDAFVDLTRNGSRRFCSDRCSNRVHARLHRERARAS